MDYAAVEAHARRALEDGGRMSFPAALGEPDLASWLTPRLPDKPDVELMVPFRVRDEPLVTPPSVRRRSLFGGRSEANDSTYLPMRLGHLSKAIRPGCPLYVDLALLRLSPPDSDGMYSVGPSASLTLPLAIHAGTVIAEIDPDLPRTKGSGAKVPPSMIDVVVDAQKPLFAPVESDVELPSANYEPLADLIPDGAVLEIGLGRSAQAVIDSLQAKSGLRFHSGLVTSDLVRLINGPAADHRAPVLVAEAIGAANLMEEVQGNDRYRFETSETIHNPTLLGSYERFVTINSVLAVDLLGRISAERAGDRIVGGLGGLIDFLEGGAQSRGGFNILIVPTDRHTGRVRMVSRLSSEQITVPSYLADFIVTEWGVADLRCTLPAERSARLLEVADPQTVELLDGSAS